MAKQTSQSIKLRVDQLKPVGVLDIVWSRDATDRITMHNNRILSKQGQLVAAESNGYPIEHVFNWLRNAALTNGRDNLRAAWYRMGEIAGGLTDVDGNKGFRENFGGVIRILFNRRT